MAFSSAISASEHVIDDSNYQLFVTDPVIDGERKTRGLLYTQRPLGSTIAVAGRVTILDEQEIVQRAEELERKQQRISDFIRNAGVPCKNQNGIPYCWIFGPVGVMEVTRIMQGLPYVSLSPASTGGRIKNFREVGGWGTEALQGLSTMGCCPSSLWPDTAVRRQYLTEANIAESLNYRVVEWDDLPTTTQAAASCCVTGQPVAVGYNWWGHEVYATDAIVEGGRLTGLRIRNSWGANWGDNGFSVLKGRKAKPDDAVTARSIVPYAHI